MATEDNDIGDINVESPSTGMLELETFMNVLTKVDLDLGFSSEKLVNLHVLLITLLAQENDLEAMAVGNNYVSADFIEKALVFNLSSGILDSEVRELDSFMDSAEAEIFDAHQKISSCRHLREIYTTMEKKLHDSEESFIQSRNHILEMKLQSAKLQRTALAFAHDNWKTDIDPELSETGLLSNVNAKSNLQMAGQQRHILRMLEKSLARELDLEKKLIESRQGEEELKLKLHYKEQIAFHMEEAAEVVWGRFLEADNSAEVLRGVSKELVGQLHLVHFHLNSLIQRENDLKSKLQDSIEELKGKETALEKLKSSNEENSANNAELSSLREKVKFLEEKLKASEIQLKDANSTNKSSQEKLAEMESIIDSLRESIYMADTRAESAELKVAELTGSNVEITEELNFLKGSASKAEKKVGGLEKQLREAEIQLQHAKLSSEASQEQQNMLYSAIWDMETLIEDLKSKVAKADNKNESAESIALSETNLKLNKELSILRARMGYLETSLDQVNTAKFARANEINVRTKFIMDMVMQLAVERERIQKQLHALTKENKVLTEKLCKTMVCNNEDGDSNASCAKSSLQTVAESLGNSYQVDESSQDPVPCDNSVKDSVSVNSDASTVSDLEPSRIIEAKRLNLKYVSLAIFVSLLSMSVLYLLNQKPFFFNDL
ncbi:WPP domain-interacting tail-anchored protein 2 isoform X2 [Ziziphus jujuba]|nr:WPP domain-interacting tail-anchored protein 2 isoform X2 [Ziziphus jujuba]